MSEKLVYDGLQRCPYLEGRVARMPLYRQLRRLSLAQADARFANAERRVGSCLYRTACPTCRACEGIRLPVADFRPSRSQRRVLKRWGDRGRIEVGPVTFTQEKLELFNRHKQQRGLVADEDGEMSALGYASWLVQSCVLTVEMRYYFDDALVGVGVVDLGMESASSVYFYFDPDRSELSPGVFSALEEIELCRRSGRRYLYLGLYVEGCRHLSYKANYKPHERLVDGDWRLTS
ncbi:MAG TPA: arginyltransferase [Deltaproteobacteria bacterium]|nr:arginyltransferase [Deltaproteobacteria bacterium]